MYASYNKQSVGKRDRFTRHEQISLFGRNAGFIPWLLSKSISKTQGEPFAWHLEIPSALRSLGADYPEANSVIIDIKPGNKDGVYLCELTDVWGYSSASWTPMMWGLKHCSGKLRRRSIGRISKHLPMVMRFTLLFMRRVVSKKGKSLAPGTLLVQVQLIPRSFGQMPWIISWTN